MKISAMCSFLYQFFHVIGVFFSQKKKGGKNQPGKSAKTSPKRGETPSAANLAAKPKTPIAPFSTEDVVDG